MITEKTFRMIAFVVICAGVSALAWTKQDPTFLVAIATYMLKSPTQPEE